MSQSGETLSLSVSRDQRTDVFVGTDLLRSLPDRWAKQWAGRTLAFVTDHCVEGLYAEALREACAARGFRALLAAIAPGESSKTVATWQGLVERLQSAGFDRHGIVVNVGGGVVCDVGGMVAATYLRGVDYVNVPTTLLAQHDAAIGGKVAVNVPWAKNFLGAFHHPLEAVCDVEVLATLDQRQIAAGVAESVKVALTGDAALFELLERGAARILDTESVVLEDAVRRSIAQKVRLLEPDPYERDLRRALNLGHTFGHALEAECGYTQVLHGEAVAWGMAVATEVSLRRGVCDTETAERVHRLLRAYGLPPRMKRETLVAALHRLKEIRLVRAGRLHFVLPAEIDRVEIVPELEPGELERALDACWQRGFGVRAAHS